MQFEVLIHEAVLRERQFELILRRYERKALSELGAAPSLHKRQHPGHVLRGRAWMDGRDDHWRVDDRHIPEPLAVVGLVDHVPEMTVDFMVKPARECIEAVPLIVGLD